MTEPTQDPVFIVGTGRCGSTMLHDALCLHNDVCWLTPLADRYPWRPGLNARALDLGRRVLPQRALRRLLPPVEPYRFFEGAYGGFSRPYRDLTEGDYRPGAAKKFRSRVAAASVSSKQFIAKYTGWSRMSLLSKVFPDARFVHIVRDGRAVVSSALKAGYFDGWAGPENWARGRLRDNQQQAWERSGESYVTLAAIGWENRIHSFQETAAAFDENHFLEIRYEDFCDDPAARAEEILAFMGLSEASNRRFFKALATMEFRSANDGWRRDLTEQQQAELSDYLGELNASYGYT
ncbi:MAG: sulfotransferase [Pseudomonadota bacterium]